MTEVDFAAVSKAAKDIVFDAAKIDTLHELTPKQVRRQVEERLGLENGKLEEGGFKKKLKAIIEAAVAEVQGGDQDGGKDKNDPKPKPVTAESKSPKKTKKTESNKPKEKKEKTSSTSSHKRKSDEDSEDVSKKGRAKKAKVVDEPEGGAEPGPSKVSEKKPKKAPTKETKRESTKKVGVAKSKETIESDEEGVEEGLPDEEITKKPTSKKTKSQTKATKETKHEKHETREENSDEKTTEKTEKEGADETKKVVEPLNLKEEKATTETTTQNTKETSDEKSESELSVLIDEPPKKKRGRKSKDKDESEPKSKKPREKSSKVVTSPDEEQIKKLKALVFACGVRKVWARELKDCDTASKQILYIRNVLSELGMKGRFSMEQAKAIRAKREFAQEMEDIREFAERHGEGRASRSKTKEQAKEVVESDDDEESESEVERGKPRVRNARQSIMAFLEDQSDSN